MTEPPPSERPSPFHAGEMTLQRGVGVAERMDTFGRRVIRDFMPDQHRDFFCQLPFLVAGTVDTDGDVWASLLAGEPGFIRSPDPKRLTLTVTPVADDPAMQGLREGAAIGFLGIELHSRRRNRMNGTVSGLHAGEFSVVVEHSFGNCPRYIQKRSWRHVSPVEGAIPAETLKELDDAARAFIRRADTFFVASYIDLSDGRRQVDVSHRGGTPGFLHVSEEGTLTVPDYAGNRHFNTLGNLLLNPKAGLVFIDFETGDLLQLTGDTEILLQSPDMEAFPGAERLWKVRPRRLVRRPRALPLRFSRIDRRI